MSLTPGTFKLGKEPAVHDDRTLVFGDYLTAALAPPPDAVDYYSSVAGWPMYDNDKWGDCTVAAAGHMIQSWTTAAGDPTTPRDSAIDRMYEHFVGNPPPPDAGCNMLDVLNYWRHSGLARHKISSYAALTRGNHGQLKNAIYLFGSAYLGVELPKFATQPGKMLTTPWEVPPGGAVGDAAPDPDNGHCIPAVGYDQDHVYIVTWGALKTMSWDFYDAYTDEAFAVLSTDFLDKVTKNTIAGFNLDELRADLARITQQPA